MLNGQTCLQDGSELARGCCAATQAACWWFIDSLTKCMQLYVSREPPGCNEEGSKHIQDLSGGQAGSRPFSRRHIAHFWIAILARFAVHRSLYLEVAHQDPAPTPLAPATPPPLRPRRFPLASCKSIQSVALVAGAPAASDTPRSRRKQRALPPPPPPTPPPHNAARDPRRLAGLRRSRLPCSHTYRRTAAHWAPL